MTNWKKGDKALCINNGNLPGTPSKGTLPPLRLNVEYVVHAVNVCECGGISLDVGLASGSTGQTKCGCSRFIGDAGIHWANARRFVKKRPKGELYKELHDAVQDENFELAAELQKEIELCNNKE